MSRPVPIHTEPLARDAQGQPYSERYADIYASRSGALGQARAVFLTGCGLLDTPAAWSAQRQFVILEIGFGLGTNFLATWQAWLDDPARPDTLHYVGVELHPLRAEDLRRACADPALLPLAQELAAQWPEPVRGLHPLRLQGGRICLTLALGDAQSLVPQLDLGANAIFLDAFAPARNAVPWQSTVLKAVGRLARPGARLASYTVARSVCDGLRDAGFDVTTAPGYGGKAQRLQAVYAPRWRTRRLEPRTALRAEHPRRAMVIGAGLAGAACARALATRGWTVEVLHAAGADLAPTGASTLPAGLAHVRIAPDDDRLARLTRAGLAALRHALPAQGPHMAATALWRDGGVFLAQADGVLAENLHGVAQSLALPSAVAEAVDARLASIRAGIPLTSGGWWAAGGVAAASCLIDVWLRTPGVRLQRGLQVCKLGRATSGCLPGTQWQALDVQGRVLAQAPTCIVATALDAVRLLHASGLLAHETSLPMRAQPGQGFIVPAAAVPALASLRHGVVGDCYALPLPSAAVESLGLPAATPWLFVGATYEEGAAASMPAALAWAHIVRGLQPLVGSLPDELPAAARRFGGVRAVTRDRLPCVGAWPDWTALAQGHPALRQRPPTEWPAQSGLYLSIAMGSRGLILEALAAECIATHLEGEPAPIERDLLAALAPGRFALRPSPRGGQPDSGSTEP